MSSLSMSTERLKHLLKQFEEKKFDHQVCSANDILGPGGGIYIKANSALNEQHLSWLERRSLSPDTPTYVDVVFLKGGAAVAEVSSEFDLSSEPAHSEKERRKKAEETSREVTARADDVAKQAGELFRSVGKVDFSVAALRKASGESGLKEFEQRFKVFKGAVQNAVDEYLNGNTLVMDLILKFQLDKGTVRHGLNVAAFATEIASLLALGGEGTGGQLDDYFGDLSNKELLGQLGEPTENSADLSAKAVRKKRFQLFKKELVETFLGGFMHDCGLWNELVSMNEGHEVKGAKLIWALPEIHEFAPALAKIVLFHSDIGRLADRYGVVKIVEAPDDPEKTSFKREFYKTDKDAQAAIEMLSGDCRAEVLDEADLRQVLPVALAERYITQTQDVHAKSRLEVVNELARYIENGLYLKYMVVLCNAQVEVIAPRRSYVKLDGHLSITVDAKKDSRRARRMDLKDFDAGSIYHGGDRNSPHLITLFTLRPDGSRAKAEYVAPADQALWERSAGMDHRMYIPVGRFHNNVSLSVTGFMSEEVYRKILGEYEREFKRRMRS
jgi:hypothetical protein